MCIVTGPNQDIAIKLIKRIKALFDKKLEITFDNKETVLELNGCTIEAYPSNHIESYRVLDNPKFILLDEADFFHKNEQEDVRHVSERYIGKSDPFIVMISTPNAPEGLFEKIEKESEDTCIYKRIFLDYSYGLDKIYSKEEIEKAKQSPSFEREYNLKYLGKIGNVFHTKDIDESIERGKNYDPMQTPSYLYGKVMGIDPGYGSSPFGICIVQWKNQIVEILYAEQFERPDYNDILAVIYDQIKHWSITKIYVDGSNAAFVKSLKRMLGENEYYEKYSREEMDRLDITNNMKVIPVSFSLEHKQMLQQTKIILEKGVVAINPKFDKLITALRTAVEQDGTLDKESTSYPDIMDAFRLSLKAFRFGQREKPRIYARFV